jgi:hypothetical protein
MRTQKRKTMIRLIGLHGKKQSGKDSSFRLLNQRLDMPVARDAFADRLKLSAIRNFLPDTTLEEAYEICEGLKTCGGVTLTVEHGPYDIQELYVSGREFLQHYGTGPHRQVFADDFWVSAVLPDLNDPINFGRSDEKPWSLLIVTDVRFPNEAQAIRDAGGVVWQIIRPELEDGATDTHASEVPLDPEYIDTVIVNDGTLHDLSDKLFEAWQNVHTPTTYAGV